MSDRQRRRARYQLHDSERLRYLVSVLSLDELKRLGFARADPAEQPSRREIVNSIDVAIARYRQAHARLIKKPLPSRVNGAQADVFLFDDLADEAEFAGAGLTVTSFEEGRT